MWWAMPTVTRTKRSLCQAPRSTSADPKSCDPPPVDLHVRQLCLQSGRQRPGGEYFEGDGAAVLAIGAPRQPERPTARRGHVRDTRATCNGHDRMRAARWMTFDQHVGS